MPLTERELDNHHHRGLTRVRCFHQDDAHIFCRPDQMLDEISSSLQFIQDLYERLGLPEFELRLSTRPDKYMGEISLWDEAEGALREALDRFGGRWTINEGDGAFYGPKIDIHVFDALRRRHQCGTIQLDFQLPQRFNLTYQGASHIEDDEMNCRGNARELSGLHRPVCIHRAAMGSLERIVAILCEHYGGRWPLWLSPRTWAICPVSEGQVQYAEEVIWKLRKSWAQTPLASEPLFSTIYHPRDTLKKRISVCQREQTNYILVVGDAEVTAGTINVRSRDGHVIGEKTCDDLIAILIENWHELATVEY